MLEDKALGDTTHGVYRWSLWLQVRSCLGLFFPLRDACRGQQHGPSCCKHPRSIYRSL
jgi:hypothetical protein